MIKIEYLVDRKGADGYGTCMGCGKGSDEDKRMVRVAISFSNRGTEHGTTFCLCDKCRTELKRWI